MTLGEMFLELETLKNESEATMSEQSHKSTEDQGKMTESEMEGWLQNAIEDYAADEETDVRTRTFDEYGVMTKNKGLVITLVDGSEYQVTIVQTSGSCRKEAS